MFSCFLSLSGSSSQWWDPDVMETLPVPVEEARKSVALLMPVTVKEPKVQFVTDLFITFLSSDTYQLHDSCRQGHQIKD